MSILNDLIAKVSALTAIVNQLTTNSKAIQELPAQETLNPDSLIHVSKDNVSKKISVQQIINAAISNQNDQIISIGTITLSGNDLTISDISAKINNVIQSISLPTIINIPFCASGFKRIDLLVYNTSNEITRIAGTETSGAIVIAPTLPINCLLITEISVIDSVISEPQPPILGNNFLQKEYEKSQVVNTSGNAVVIPLNIKGRNNIILNGALTGVVGFSLTNLDANPASAEYPHEGKDYYIQNKTGHEVTLKNFDTTVDIAFLSKDGNDIVVPNNGIVFFKNSSYVLQEIFRSYDSFDISLKADLVAGKVPASQLPSYVDDVLEFANLATLPTTGEAGKIYVTIDSNKQYRWGGTGYIEISASTAVWGSIGGTIANQTDLIALLNAKQNTISATANRLLRYTPGGIVSSIIHDDGTNVGIGTTSPSEKLTVSDGKLSLTILDSTIGGKIYGYNDTSVNLYSGGLKFQTRDFNGSNYVYVDRLTINSSGNVGIGTTSPLQKLHVEGISYFGSNIFTLNDRGIFFSGNNSFQRGIYSNTRGLTLQTLGSPKVTITDGGNVGIGTTTPEDCALIELESISKGFLPPRMRTGDRDNMASPVHGLMIFNTDTETLDLYTNANGWKQLIY